MTIHFTEQEFGQRQYAVRRSLVAEGLDGLLIFRQESMYYLTGYDTSGYSMFQGMYMDADGKLFLLTRSADRIQSRLTSVIGDIRIWEDGDGVNPGIILREVMREYGAGGRKIGIEYHAYGLTGQRSRMIDEALSGFCVTTDASDLVRKIRLVKSESELAYIRKAGKNFRSGLAGCKSKNRSRGIPWRYLRGK